MLLEVNEAGEVILPAELVQAPPHTQLEADRRVDGLVLKRVTEPEPRLSILSLRVFQGKAVDPNMTFQREDIYGDDGR